MTNYAVEDFSNAMLAGGGLQDCLHAFKVWGVYGLWTLLAAYVMLVLAAVVLARNALRDVPVPVLALSLAILAVPLVTGIWALDWGLWVTMS